jgi:hypothetical protein
MESAWSLVGITSGFSCVDWGGSDSRFVRILTPTRGSRLFAANRGDVVLLHHRQGKQGDGGRYHASAFLMSPPGGHGHKDVVRCLYHDARVSLCCYLTDGIRDWE